MITARIARGAGAAIAGLALALTATAAYADDDVDDGPKTEDCIVEDAGDGGDVEADLDTDVLGVATDKPEHAEEKSNNGNGKKDEKSNNGKGNSDDKVTGKDNKCLKAEERAAREALREAVRESGGSWGRVMSQEAHVRVATKLAERVSFLPDAAKSHALLSIMTLLGVNLEEGADLSDIFPEEFDFESVYEYIVELAALKADSEGDEDDIEEEGDEEESI